MHCIILNIFLWIWFNLRFTVRNMTAKKISVFCWQWADRTRGWVSVSWMQSWLLLLRAWPLCGVWTLPSRSRKKKKRLSLLLWCCLSLQMLDVKVFSQVSTVWKDHSLPLQEQVCSEASVPLVIIALRAAAYPRPVQPALTKTRPEAKANMTVNYVLLVCIGFIYIYKKMLHPPSLRSAFSAWMSFLGWFQEVLGQAECKPCPPGFHCQALTSIPLPCPAGYVCPGNSPPLPCPRGTYSPTQGLSSMGKNCEKFFFSSLQYSWRREVRCKEGEKAVYRLPWCRVEWSHPTCSLFCGLGWGQRCQSLFLQVSVTRVRLVSSVHLRVS